MSQEETTRSNYNATNNDNNNNGDNSDSKSSNTLDNVVSLHRSEVPPVRNSELANSQALLAQSALTNNDIAMSVTEMQINADY